LADPEVSFPTSLAWGKDLTTADMAHAVPES